MPSVAVKQIAIKPKMVCRHLSASLASFVSSHAHSLLLLGEDLGLEGVGSGEVDGDLVGGDLVVDLSHSLDL